MANKIGNNTPSQSFESLAHAFEGVLESRSDETYFVAKKTKAQCEIDGVMRGDITYLYEKNKKHGAAAAAYRLSGRRAAHYKEARIYLETLISLAEANGLNTDQRLAVSTIKRVLASSKSKGCIEMNAIRGDLQIIIDSAKATTEKSAEAVKKDFVRVDDTIAHFLDDVEAARSGNFSELALENVQRQGRGNAELLTNIGKINEQARNLRPKLKPGTVSQLKLKRPTFSGPASSPAGEMTGEDLLNKFATWPGPDLQLKLALLFEHAKPEYGGESFKRASKEMLLALAEAESILSLLSSEFLNAVEDREDRGELQTLRESAEKLLLEFRKPDSPFKRLRDLALAGYHWPEETAWQIVAKRTEFFRSSLPVNGQAPLVKVPTAPASLPSPASPLGPDKLPPPVLKVVPPPNDFPPPPGNVPLDPANLPPIPTSPPPLHSGGLPPPVLNVVPPSGPPPQLGEVGKPPPEATGPLPADPAVKAAVAAAVAKVLGVPNGPSAPANLLQAQPPVLVKNGQPATVNLQPLVVPGNSSARPLPATPFKGVSGKGKSASGKPGPGGAVAPGGWPTDVPPPPYDPPPLPSTLPSATVVVPSPSSLTSVPAISNGPPPSEQPAPVSTVLGGAVVPPADGWPSNVPPPDYLPPPPSNVGSQPADNLVPAGGQPQPAVRGEFVAKRVVEYSPPISTNPSLGGKLPANVASAADVPPPDYMPPPPKNGPPSTANGLVAPANLPPPVPDGVRPPSALPREASGQLNPMEKAAAAALSAALDILPPPEEAPPPRPGNLPPPVADGVPVPPNDLPPPPGTASKPQPEPTEAPPAADPRVKADMDRLFHVRDVPAVDNPPPPATSAAKLLADLTSNDQIYLKASKTDDGTGHKVITEDGVLYLKVADEESKHGKADSLLRKLPHNRFSQYRETRRALKALMKDAEIRGLTSKNGDAKEIQNLLAIRRFVDFKDAASHVQAMLGEDVERQTKAAYRNEVISDLLGSFEQTPTAGPQAAVDEFVTAAGEAWKTSVIGGLKPKNIIDYIGLGINNPAFKFGNSTSHADQRIFDMATSMKNVINLGMKIQKAGGKTKSDPDDHYEFSSEFLQATDSFIKKNMSDEFKSLFPEPTGFISAASSLLASRISGHWNILFNGLKNSGTQNFKLGVLEFRDTIPKQIKKVAYLAQLFTDERYLEIVPIEMRKVFIEFGLGLQDWLLKALDGESLYMKLHQMLATAVVNPDDVYERLYPSNPPDRPVPPIPQEPVQAG